MPAGNGTHSPWPIPIDPYSVPQAPSYGVVELARALRGRRVLFIGDSVTEQMTGALRCLAASTLPGGIEPVVEELDALSMRKRCLRLHALKSHRLNPACPGAWRRRCSVNTTELGAERCAECGKNDDFNQQRRAAMFAWAHLAWPCKDPSKGSADLNPSMAENGTLRLQGYRAPHFNLTWFPNLGGKMDRFPTADLRRFGRDGASADEPISARWPSRVEFVRERRLVDVVVLNFGLHYHAEAEYVGALQAAFNELKSFASARPGKRVAVFRETSAQHFAATDGDYDHADAKARGRIEIKGAPRAPACSDADVCVQPCRPLAKNTSAWRNRALHRVASSMRVGAHASSWQSGVRVQPFEHVTRARWDFHVASKTDFNQKRHQWFYDCTHYCYSPSFWQESLHDLRVTIEPNVARNARKVLSKVLPPSKITSNGASTGTGAAFATRWLGAIRKPASRGGSVRMMSLGV